MLASIHDGGQHCGRGRVDGRETILRSYPRTEIPAEAVLKGILRYCHGGRLWLY